jgi:predicted secreted hydrolase
MADGGFKLAADQLGWDWFALQLSDGSELMFYNLRKLDGSQDEHSAGTWISADGASTHIDIRRRGCCEYRTGVSR